MHIIRNVGIMYENLDRNDKKSLLWNIFERIIVDAKGNITNLDLLPPFSYLRQITEHVSAECDEDGQKAKISPKADLCSNRVPLCVPGGIRTPDLRFRRPSL